MASIRLWEPPPTGAALLKDDFEHGKMEIACLAINPDGKSLAAEDSVHPPYRRSSRPLAYLLGP